MARELDPITGLYYVRNRWYDPVDNRFVSEDPIGLAGGINTYAYVGNDPMNFRDPWGLDPTIEKCIAELMEQRSEGSLMWTDETIRKACGAGGGSLVLDGLTVRSRIVTTGEDILRELMARSDLQAAIMGIPLMAQLGNPESPRPLVYFGIGAERAFVGCPDEIKHFAPEMTFAGMWHMWARSEVRSVFGAEYRLYRGYLQTVKYGERNAQGQIFCEDGFAVFTSLALW